VSRILALAVAGCTSTSNPADDSDPRPYLERLANHQTVLLRRKPSPETGPPLTPPPGVKEVRYRSGSHELLGFLALPKGDADLSHRRAAIVFFHGGFAFSPEDFVLAEPFADAGFVVFMPTLRGENGNPGVFEMLLGEIEDAKAAVQWTAKLDYVDPARVYTFGHSSGGAISALLSLRRDVPVKHGGSSGGLYGGEVFDRWKDKVPFEARLPKERRLRLLLGNLADMHRPHHAYVGDADGHDAIAARVKAERQTMLSLHEVPGDHFTSLPKAAELYIERIRSEGSVTSSNP
jgi:acetyl esterase/lipase